MRHGHRLLALGVAFMVVACRYAGAPVYQPSGSPQPVVRAGDFTLEISSPRSTWPAGVPIEVVATLAYARPGPITVIGAGAGPIAFGVREIGGTRAMEAVMTGDAERHVIGPGPFVAEYAKSGGWDPDDPNLAFYEDFFADPEFRLPPGRWEVEAWARFETGEGGPRTVDTRAALWITVE